MKRYFSLYLLILIILIAVAGCYPRKTAEVKDFDIVVTYHNTDFDFSTIHYYYLPDTINVIVDKGQEGSVNHKYDNIILEQIRTNLNALGWVESPDSTHLNDAVSVLVSMFNTDYYTVYTYPWYDYWYWYWDPWFYWKAPTSYYPYYPWNPGYAYYSYTSGTIVIEMAYMGDIHSPSVSSTIPIEWVGVLNGIVDNTSSNLARIKEGINQSFQQSSYLKY